MEQKKHITGRRKKIFYFVNNAECFVYVPDNENRRLISNLVKHNLYIHVTVL